MTYGINDNSYQAAGKLAGIEQLVADFYQYMDSLPEAAVIRAMHQADLTLSQKKLSYFLSGWLGGPKLYGEHFGSINIPQAHCHLPVNETERDAWLLCMEKALNDQDYPADFKHYLMCQLRIPAERIRVASQTNR